MELLLGADGALTLVSPDDFGRFALRREAGAPTRHNEITPAEEADHVWVSRSAVTAAAGSATSDAWIIAFDNMVAKAAKYGWVSPDGQFIKAHVLKD